MSVSAEEDTCGNYPGVQHHRTLSSVLSRLSNILDRRSQVRRVKQKMMLMMPFWGLVILFQTPQAYKDSDFKQYWMPDSNCRECYECGDRFNTFRRRHHCRICGQIFCSRCCNQEVPGSIMGYTGKESHEFSPAIMDFQPRETFLLHTGFLRVCTYCCRVVLSYAKNPDVSGDFGTLSEDLASQLMSSDPDVSPGSMGQQGTWGRKKSRELGILGLFPEEPGRQRWVLRKINCYKSFCLLSIQYPINYGQVSI